jgi:hypothetical protein
MDLKIAAVINQNQFKLITIENNQLKDIIIDLSDIEEQEIDLILLKENLDYSNNLKFFEKAKNFIHIGFYADELKLEVQWLVNLYQKMTAAFAFKSNLSLMEEIFSVNDHLKKLYLKDRNTFFEELWMLLKRNTGASEVKLLFHDISDEHLSPKDPEASERKNEKQALLYAKINGRLKYDYQTADESEKTLMQHYKDKITKSFEIDSFKPENGELVCTMHVNQSPIIGLIKTGQVPPSFNSLFTGLFEGLQTKV